MAAMRVLLALIFTFLLLRRQRLGEGAALAGAFAFGLGGFLLLWLGWPLANSAALLPAALYAVARYDEQGGRRDFLLLGLAAFALLLGGHPETVLYTLGCVLPFPGRPLTKQRLCRGTVAFVTSPRGGVKPAFLRRQPGRAGTASPSVKDVKKSRHLPGVYEIRPGSTRFCQDQ
jgi:hypothetical protein